MGFSLDGKVAVVTGAARGNGAAIAAGLAQYGASVVVVDVDEEGAHAMAARLQRDGHRAWAFGLDVRDSAACGRFAREAIALAGRVDVLVNNAGVRPYHAFDAPERDRLWRQAMDVNVEAVRHLSLAFEDALAASGGTIVNITSTAATFASPRSISYSTSKAAAQMLTRVLALELAPRGIRVNAIAPGVMETAMTAASRADPVRSPQLMQRIPLRRFGNPEELVGAAVFLASGMSSYMTGSVITVDGGFLVSC
ncbi:MULTISPECIES: glucose 1-dehydrogenase [unclassified Variovorax]|uniref:SDR family NAD(P)-dependent oxidoreductase n=1 Tax=unclassified Variovorax TaxID=663243 RepID=UPI002577142D|nr:MULTISPECIES: glucose 1-dehydrogenase [unclassified Variovorax]MDM0090002.1 glucose 1-dehydrogenase [Variovorax sp. J22G40]MDM0148332.1 glucose 1-dehydrogenase [Variovorax sp. J2P1-31]